MRGPARLYWKRPDFGRRGDFGIGPLGTGTGDAAVPAPYRRRVAEYFQRIADETGGK